MTLKRMLNLFAVHQTEEKKTKSINDALMRTPCYHAKEKNMIIYSPEAIDSAIGMEKKRQKFCNGEGGATVQKQENQRSIKDCDRWFN